MKVFIREPAGGELVRGYLPLEQEADDAWHAITEEPVDTAEAAEDICRDHLQAEIWNLATELQGVVARLHRLETNLQRLRDGPRQQDRIVVRGVPCPVTDGAITMPPPRDETGSQWQIAGLPDAIAAGIAPDDELLDVVRRAAGEPDMSRRQVLQMISDMIRDEPIEFLLAVAEVAPEQVARAANLSVAVRQASGERSLWASEREARKRARETDEPAPDR